MSVKADTGKIDSKRQSLLLFQFEHAGSIHEYDWVAAGFFLYRFHRHSGCTKISSPSFPQSIHSGRKEIREVTRLAEFRSAGTVLFNHFCFSFVAAVPLISADCLFSCKSTTYFLLSKIST